MKNIIRKILKEDSDFEWMGSSKIEHKPLDYREKCVYYVDYYDLEKLIREVFKNGYKIDDYSIPADLESGNDVTHEVYPELYYREEFIKWASGEGRYGKWSATPSLHEFMGALVEMGVIPDGEWMVRVSW